MSHLFPLNAKENVVVAGWHQNLKTLICLFSTEAAFISDPRTQGLTEASVLQLCLEQSLKLAV